MGLPMMHVFLVGIWFIFAGQNEHVEFRVSAPNAEQATRIGLRLGRDLACLDNGHQSRCVAPGSYAVKTTQK